VRVSSGHIVDLLKHLALRPVAAGSLKDRSVFIGLVGRGIEQSRSPIMHEREGSRIGLTYTYILIDFDKHDLPDTALGEVVNAAETLGFAGLNVTHPLKQSMIQYVTRLSPDASAIGAINTVLLKNRERIGHNTDCWGFMESFREGMAECPLTYVTQFGAGGAGAAVSYALMELGVSNLVIIDPDHARAEELAKRLSNRFPGQIKAARSVADSIARSNGIVNATPIGMAKYPGTPFPPHLLTAQHWVAEVIYFPEITELLRYASQLGCRTLKGTGMAIYQAVRAFELFTGIAPDRAAMARHFETAA
jgi:shikimate dehydrogenase